MSDKFQRFGKYLILDHLVDGGMAKICRARYLGEQANKMVAVKMVQPQFSNDEAFVRMFQDELNITFGMLHPNIMQVYDYGKVKGQLYTAMEYIHGANLKQYLDRLKEKKVVFPVEISSYIISQVCLGLHYAHTFTDKLTGKPYNIIHRDISPHNIMLTYDGAIKVIDFGIAKANTNSEATQAGTIKGKLSYLAPEYLDGIELDARYDEFAVGITLWEMLCSRKLFQANNDLAVLKQIQACKVTPPSEINPSVPKELDAIVMKALSKDRSQRYENLDQMNRALVRFLYSNYPEFNASDLQTFANDLFKNEILKDEEKFVEYGKIDIVPYIEEMKQEESRTGKISKKDIPNSKEPVREKIREIELNIEPLQVAIAIENTDKTSTRKLNKALLQNSGAPLRVAKNPAHSIPKSVIKEKTMHSSARKSLDKDVETKSSTPAYILVLVASFIGLAYFQGDAFEEMFGINFYKLIHGSNERNISSADTEIKLKKANVPSHSNRTDSGSMRGEIILGGMDPAMEVYLNGRKTEYTGRPLKVEEDQEAVITVKKVGYLPFVQKVTPTKNKLTNIIAVPEMVRARIGLLTSSQNYTAGSKLVYESSGVVVEKQLPFRDLEIPEGRYQAKVINPILGTEKKVEFTIEENKKHFLE
jgi:eukaryotic-like serine/threonine-protein kinase